MVASKEVGCFRELIDEVIVPQVAAMFNRVLERSVYLCGGNMFTYYSSAQARQVIDEVARLRALLARSGIDASVAV